MSTIGSLPPNLLAIAQAHERAFEQAKSESAFEKDLLRIEDAMDSEGEKSLARIEKTYDPKIAQTKKRSYEVMEGQGLGKGSFGEVSKARVTGDKSKCVAVKTFNGLTKEDYLKAEHEALVLKKLRDADAPHCVHLVDSYTDKDESHFKPVIVMDLAEGLTLDKFSLPDKNISMRDIKTIARSVLEHLAHLHSEGRVHGDLKCDNIMFNPKDRSTKVLDFGNSHKIGENYPVTLQVQEVRSPEVVLGKPYDIKMDVWSLGCILFEFLENRTLFHFHGENGSLELSKKHIKKIVKLIGLPPYTYLQNCNHAAVFFDIDHEKHSVRLKGDGRDFENAVFSESTGAPSTHDADLVNLIDLLSKMVAWDRPFPEDLLKHPFFQDEISFDLRVIVPPERQVAFQFHLPPSGGSAFRKATPELVLDATGKKTCVHLPKAPEYIVTLIDKEAEKPVMTLKHVDIGDQDSITFNVLEDL